MVRSMLRTLDISVRYLGSELVGQGGLACSDRLLRAWARDIMRYGDLSVSASGLSVFEQPPPFVVMSNHVSLLDIPLLILVVPHTLRMVTKQELMKIPVWGRAMLRSGFIPISRGDRTRAIEQLRLARERLDAGVSVWISPEGTRSRDGRLREFKKGGFHLAIDLGVPILPTWIEGAQRALPPDTLLVQTGQSVSVHFGAPIPTAGLGPDDIPALMAEVQRRLLALRPGAGQGVAETISSSSISNCSAAPPGITGGEPRSP